MTIGHLDDESNELMQMSYCNNTMIRKTECQYGHDVSTAGKNNLPVFFG